MRVLALGMVLLLAGCGYHQVGTASHIPVNVRTLGIPIFVSKVQAYNTETAFTQAVVRERCRAARNDLDRDGGAAYV
jgi:outer membrane lipopolysaccharide assembly protein LptE/RlpB